MQKRQSSIIVRPGPLVRWRRQLRAFRVTLSNLAASVSAGKAIEVASGALFHGKCVCAGAQYVRNKCRKQLGLPVALTGGHRFWLACAYPHT